MARKGSIDLITERQKNHSVQYTGKPSTNGLSKTTSLLAELHFMYTYMYFFEWGRGRGSRREKIVCGLHAKCRARRRAQSHNPEITT